MDIFPIHFPYISTWQPFMATVMATRCHLPSPWDAWRAASSCNSGAPAATFSWNSHWPRNEVRVPETGTGNRNINRQDRRKNWRTTGERYRWIDGDRFFTGQLRGEVLFANFLWDKKNKTNLKASLLFYQAEDRARWGVDCQSQHKIILFTWYYITSRSHHAMFLQKGSWTEMIEICKPLLRFEDDQKNHP